MVSIEKTRVLALVVHCEIVRIICKLIPLPQQSTLNNEFT